MSDTICTERLLLRPLRPTDAEALYTLFGDWEVIRWLSTPPWPYTLDDARSFIAGQLALEATETDYLAITLEGALIGGIDCRSTRAAEAASRSRVLGYWLGQPFWGRGYMTEAARAFVGHLFASTAEDAIFSGAFADNAASLRVQNKLGFERSGEDMRYCRPHGEKRVHVNTRLARLQFLAKSS